MLWERGVLLICQIKRRFDGTNCHCDTTLFCINLSILYCFAWEGSQRQICDFYASSFLLMSSITDITIGEHKSEMPFIVSHSKYGFSNQWKQTILTESNLQNLK